MLPVLSIQPGREAQVLNSMRMAATEFYITAMHVRRLTDLFSKCEHIVEVRGTKPLPDSWRYYVWYWANSHTDSHTALFWVQVVQIWYSRIVDRRNMGRLLRALPPSAQRVVGRRLGVVNFVDRNRPDLNYSLRLSHPDELEVRLTRAPVGNHHCAPSRLCRMNQMAWLPRGTSRQHTRVESRARSPPP